MLTFTNSRIFTYDLDGDQQQKMAQANIDNNEESSTIVRLTNK